MNKREVAVSQLEARIGHVFQDRELLERALTHASVGSGSTKTAHNERLEFLGDRVLNLMAAERLMELRPEAREGEMSRLMNKIITYQACARVARLIGLPAALRVGHGETKTGTRDNDKVLGDACEALIAALYIEGGLALAKTFFQEFWVSELATMDEAAFKDSKTLLQEWAMARGLPVPRYDVVAQSGSAHEPVFTIEVSIEGQSPERAQGRSKLEAQKAVANIMLSKLETAQ
ncbi:MAG: ribonuclease III [Phenylobacterium sp.]|nr:ribonuclease III [Phenylobacterium sp.]